LANYLPRSSNFPMIGAQGFQETDLPLFVRCPLGILGLKWAQPPYFFFGTVWKVFCPAEKAGEPFVGSSGRRAVFWLFRVGPRYRKDQK